MMLKTNNQKEAIQNPLVSGAVALCILAAVGGVLFLTKELNNTSLTASVSQFELVLPPKQEDAFETPVLQEVLVSPMSVSPGESIQVTVGAANAINGIVLIDVYGESPTGASFAKASIINIDGQGKRFGNVTIPPDAEQGIWIIKTISIMDVNSKVTDYQYGKDMFATFLVTTP